ncbi:hypothetical protein LCGC14_2881180, partial [marine sediment metagenome]
MALTLNNLVGFETGGLEEAISVIGSPVLDEGVVRTGSYSLRLPAIGDAYRVAMVTGGSVGGNDYIVGFAFRRTTLPSAGWYFFSALDDSALSTYALLLTNGGDVEVRDADQALIGTITNPFTADTWHFVEIRWQHSASGAIDVWIDGNPKLSETGQNLTNGNTVSADDARYSFQYPSTSSSGAAVYLDDITKIEVGAAGIDIDLGLYFEWAGNAEDGENEPEDLKALVQTALQEYQDNEENDATGVEDPKERCNRISFDPDFHIDVPCYHLDADRDARSLATETQGWEESDPKAIYVWFKDEQKDQALRTKVRRQVRYLKMWAALTFDEGARPSSI